MTKSIRPKSYKVGISIEEYFSPIENIKKEMKKKSNATE